MAGGIQNHSVNRFPWANATGGVNNKIGLTTEEVKLNQGLEVKDAPEHLPIATRGPVEFIQPSRSAEHVRLSVPAADNLFATPTGPKHDHMMVRQALGRSGSKVSRHLMRGLKKPPAGITENSLKQMRASLTREHAMHVLLGDLQDMQKQIYGQIIGSQVG